MDATLEIIRNSFDKYNIDIGNVEIENNYFEKVYILDNGYIENKTTINKISNLIKFYLDKSVEIVLPYKAGRVGVKIKNTSERKPIYFKDIVETNSRLNLPLFLGMNNRNKKIVVDMIDLPHLLVAGATDAEKV